MFPLVEGGVGGRCGASLRAQPRARDLGAQNRPLLRHPKNEAVGGAGFLPRELVNFGRGFCTVFGRKRPGWVTNGLGNPQRSPMELFSEGYFFFSFRLRASRLWRWVGRVSVVPGAVRGWGSCWLCVGKGAAWVIIFSGDFSPVWVNGALILHRVRPLRRVPGSQGSGKKLREPWRAPRPPATPPRCR